MHQQRLLPLAVLGLSRSSSSTYVTRRAHPCASPLRVASLACAALLLDSPAGSPQKPASERPSKERSSKEDLLSNAELEKHDARVAAAKFTSKQMRLGYPIEAVRGRPAAACISHTRQHRAQSSH